MKSSINELTNKIDKIASEIEKEEPRIALFLDRISDTLEKKAYNPQGWLPGRGLNRGLGRGYGQEWIPGRRFFVPLQKYVTCYNCGNKIRYYPNLPIGNCPSCGSPIRLS